MLESSRVTTVSMAPGPKRIVTAVATVSLLLALLSGCSIVRVEPKSGARAVKIDGLVDGYLGFGISDEDRYVNVRVLGGSSSGALAEVVVWKLARLEVGAAGISVSVLPLHLGLGTLFYEPRLPLLRRFEPGEGEDEDEHEHKHDEDDDDEDLDRMPEVPAPTRGVEDL